LRFARNDSSSEVSFRSPLDVTGSHPWLKSGNRQRLGRGEASDQAIGACSFQEWVPTTIAMWPCFAMSLANASDVHVLGNRIRALLRAAENEGGVTPLLVAPRRSFPCAKATRALF
jgi:hypothetical protein